MKDKTLKIFNRRKGFSFIILFTVIGTMFFSGNIFSQTIGRVGTTAAAFLKIGVGARALAMGESYSTQAQDITAMYWNPAGLSYVDKFQATINHYDYIADIYYDYGGIAIPLENFGTVGAFIGYMGMPDIERTTIQYPNGTGEKVSASSFVIGLSYARALTDRFSIGGNVKYIRETIWHSYADGFAFDVGVLYKAFFKNVIIGMSISNFGTDMQMTGRDMLVQHDINPGFAGNNENINANLETDKFPLPILFRVGLSANIAKDIIGLDQHDWIVSIDAIHPNDNKEYLNIGTEVTLYDMISLRSGFRQLLLEDREGGFTYGFGVKFDLAGTYVNLDYANVDFGRLDHQNKFTLILSF
ncbi:MAG: PorV/PorQ family protein [bacterium]